LWSTGYDYAWIFMLGRICHSMVGIGLRYLKM
jgi:hypothetical protein